MKVVLDTNVLVSGIFFAGPPSEILAACESDPDDDKFFACALAGGVHLIVSGDKHLRNASGIFGIRVLLPRAFVDNHLRS